MSSQAKKALHLSILLFSLLIAAATYSIFVEGTTLSERLAYALIVGFSAWLALSLFIWTLVIIFYSLK